MESYQSNIALADAARRILDARRILVTTHSKPDGDAFGSVVALAAALHQRGKNVQACFMPPVPANLRTLRGYDLTRLYEEGVTQLDPFDLLVILDTGAWSQLSPLRQVLEANLQRTLIIDHHLSGDVPAQWRFIDGTAAASCEIVADLIDHMNHLAAPEVLASTKTGSFNAVISEALFVGLASDTGWFRFSNTSPRTHELAAKLLRQGVDQSELYRKLEQTERPEKLALLIRALDSLKLLADGRIAVMVLRAQDFLETNSMIEETERFVDVPQSVESVQMVMLVSETPPGNAGHNGKAPIRVNFRSKPGPDAINVAELAQQFGGGGHARAAGAKIDTPLDQAVQMISQAATQAFNRA